MLFADDLVLYEESRLEVEQQLDSWREVLEGNALIISIKKTEHFIPEGSSEDVCLAGVTIPCTNLFNYLGSTIEATGGCGAQMLITGYDQRGTLGEGYLGYYMIRCYSILGNINVYTQGLETLA